MSGFAGSGAFILIPLFVAEIAEDSVRGSLGSLMMLNCNVGILFAFIVGNYLSYDTQHIILASVPIIFFITFSFFPESPQYLMKSGNEEVIMLKIEQIEFCSQALELHREEYRYLKSITVIYE